MDLRNHFFGTLKYYSHTFFKLFVQFIEIIPNLVSIILHIRLSLQKSCFNIIEILQLILNIFYYPHRIKDNNHILINI